MRYNPLEFTEPSFLLYTIWANGDFIFHLYKTVCARKTIKSLSQANAICKDQIDVLYKPIDAGGDDDNNMCRE